MYNRTRTTILECAKYRELTSANFQYCAEILFINLIMKNSLIRNCTYWQPHKLFNHITFEIRQFSKAKVNKVLVLETLIAEFISISWRLALYRKWE